MAENSVDYIRTALDEIYSSDSRRILATLIRLLGDFDTAEDALHDAFAAGGPMARGRYSRQSSRLAYFYRPI